MFDRKLAGMRCIVGLSALVAVPLVMAQTSQNPASGTTKSGQPLTIQIGAPSDGATVPGGALTVSGTATIGAPTAAGYSGGGRVAAASGGGTASVSSSPGAAIYVVDASGSTKRPYVPGGPTTGVGLDCNHDGVVDAADDANGNGLPGELLDCEILGLIALNRSIAVSPSYGVGVVAFADTAQALDLDPVAAGVQPFTTPSADTDANGVGDVAQALATLQAHGLTNFDNAISAVNAAFATRPAGEEHTVFFLSDGADSGTLTSGSGSPLSQAAAAGTKIYTFTTVDPASPHDCTSKQAMSMIATATGASCTVVADATTLSTTIPSTPPAGITGVQVAVDGATPVAATLDAVGNWGANTSVGAVGTHGVTATVMASDGTTVTARVIVESSTPGSDSTPDAFSFVAQTGVALNTMIISAPVTITGIDTPAAISVSGGQYSINSGAFTSAASTVVAGDSVRAAVMSSPANSSKTTAVVTVGGVAGSFDATTADKKSGGALTILPLLMLAGFAALRRRRRD